MITPPYAAVWRDADNEPVGFAYGSTVCWSPVNAGDFAAASPDGEFESIFRCRKCAGCRKLDDLTLRRRLARHYEKSDKPISIVEFESQSLSPGELSARVAQHSPREFDRGFTVVSTRRITKFKIGDAPGRAFKRCRVLRRVRTTRIAQPGRARAWRSATRGMLIPREQLGAWSNRFYLQGLPAIKEQTFIQELHGGIRKRHPMARAEARAWRRDIVLYPSQALIGRTVLARLLAQTSARGAKLTINRKRPTAASSVLQSFSENPAKSAGRRPKITNSFIGNCDAGSLNSLAKELAKLRELIAKHPRDG